jgi:hypothetical protein
MQPVAQRDLACLRTRRLALRDNRGLLRRTPTAPSRCPSQDFYATQAVPIIGKLLGTSSPYLDQTRQDHPIALTRCKVPVRLRLR